MTPMKTIYLLPVLLLGVVFQSYAQRHLKGQMALTPYVGLVDNVPVPGNLKANGQGYLLGLDLVGYNSRETYWKLAYQFDVKYYDGLDSKLTTSRHTVGFDYAVGALRNRRRSLYLLPLVGGFLGLERINGNQTELPAGRILNRPVGLFGVQAGLEGEWFIGEQTALVLAMQQRYLPYSTVAQFHTYGSMGIRFSFFNH